MDSGLNSVLTKRIVAALWFCRSEYISLAPWAAACHRNAWDNNSYMCECMCLHARTHTHTLLLCLGRSWRRRPLMQCDCTPQGFFLLRWMSFGCLHGEKSGNPFFLWLLLLYSPIYSPCSSLVCVSCIKPWLSLVSYSPRDNDKTASADSESTAYRSQMNQFKEASLWQIIWQGVFLRSKGLLFMKTTAM